MAKKVIKYPQKQEKIVEICGRLWYNFIGVHNFKLR